jgi:uncharacterized membrane protein
MSELFVIGYPDIDTAEHVRDRLIQMQTEQLITMDDIVVVANEGGKIKLHQARSMTGLGAASGALWGGLIGLLFFAPILGMAVGAGSGALAGKFTDVGVDDNLMKDIGNALSPGSAAVFVLIAKMTEDKVIAELLPYGGQLLRSSLSAEQETHLRDAVKTARAAMATH